VRTLRGGGYGRRPERPLREKEDEMTVTYGACMAREGETAGERFPRGRRVGYVAFRAEGSKKAATGFEVVRFGPVFEFTAAGYTAARAVAEAAEMEAAR
jgi:hypothetical protein